MIWGLQAEGKKHFKQSKSRCYVTQGSPVDLQSTSKKQKTKPNFSVSEWKRLGWLQLISHIMAFHITAQTELFPPPTHPNPPKDSWES